MDPINKILGGHKCVKCGSRNITKGNDGLLKHCDDCGHIVNQAKAKKEYQSESKYYEELMRR